nr:hypothetical protein [uncultured Desulfobacter sp.]
MEALPGQDKVNGFIEDYVTLAKAKAVQEYISSKEADKRDAKDLVELAQCDRLIQIRQKRVHEATQLKQELDTINEKYLLGKTLNEKGCSNTKLAADYIREGHKVALAENGIGVTIDNQNLEDFIRHFALQSKNICLFQGSRDQEQPQNGSTSISGI